MGSKGGSGGGSSSSNFGISNSTYSPNPEAMAAYRRAIGMAENVTSQPFQPYQGQMVAGFSPDQMRAFEQTRQMQGMAQPYINSATALQGQALDYSDPRNFNQQTISQYYNPYQQNVIDATMSNLSALNAQSMNEANARNAAAGGFGGSGSMLGRAAVARQNALTNAQTLAGLQQQGYQQAVGQYNQQQAQAIDTAQKASYGLGQLGQSAQNAAITGIQALLGTGAQQQQQAQGQLTGAYNQWLQAQAYPYQQAAFYAGIAGGIAPNMGGTTNTMSFGMGNQQQQQAQGGGGGAGSLMSLASLLPAMFGPSDRDDKTDIKYLGKDENGEKLYAYRYKGDPKSYPKVVGPMAQDIEEDHPERVTEIGGHKIVAGLGHLSPSQREHLADGGVGTGAGAGNLGSLGSMSSTSPAGQTQSTVYDAPSTQQPQAGFGSLPPSSMDSNMSSFVQGVFDPQTANQMARAKWVNQPQPVGEESFAGDNYIIPRGLMSDGGESYPYHPSPNMPRAIGGRAERTDGGSLFDLVKQTQASGPFAGAPGNFIGEGEQVGLGKIIPLARDIAREKTSSAAESGLHSVMKEAPSGGGGGEGGMPKMPEMKLPKPAKKETPAASPAAPATESPMPLPEPVESTTPQTDPVAAADFAAAAPALPDIPLVTMFGNYQDGGRINKDGGGAASGAGFGALAAPGAGIGNIVLGDAPSASEAAGLGNVMKGQETLTGQNLLNKIDAQRFAHSAGPQLSPVEQGMPAMPDADFYTTPRQDLPSVLATQHYGEENPNPVPGFMMMSGMGGKGGMSTMAKMGFADQINQQNRAADAATKRAELKATRESMLKDPANFPVQGYFSHIADPNLNEATGLYNLGYSGAYRGYPFKDGGRVAKAGGGSISGPALYSYLVNIGATPKEATMLTAMAKAESAFIPSQLHDKVKGHYTGYGLWGHGTDRWRDMQRFTGAYMPNWQQQAQFALNELRTSPKVALARQALERANSPTSITAAGMHFERPAGYRPNAPQAGDNWGGRLANVRQYMGFAPLQQQPTSRSLAFKQSTPAFPHPSQEPQFTPAPEFKPAMAGRSPQEQARLIREAEAKAAADRNRVAAATSRRGFSWSDLSPVGSARADEVAPTLPSGVVPRVRPGFESIQGPGQLAGTQAIRQLHPGSMVAPIGMPRTGIADLDPESFSPPGMGGDRDLYGAQPQGFGTFAPTDMSPAGSEPLPRPAEPTVSQDEPAETTAAPAEKPTRKAPAETGRYWGDFRDVEPWKSDPIGGFFDELSGETPQSTKPGTVDQVGSFDLFS